MNLKPNFYSPPRLHRPLITVSSALTGAAITDPALAEPFIAAGAAVAFWFFFATEKELSPRGYERSEIIGAWWVPPSIRKVNCVVFNFSRSLCTCHPEQSEGT
jgi:hypothetical protein